MVRTKKRAFRGNGYCVLDKETGQRIINQNHSNLIEFSENQEEMEIDDMNDEDYKLYNNSENFSKPIGNQIINMQCLITALLQLTVLCPSCKMNSIILEQSNTNFGWFIKFRFKCTKCLYSNSFSNSNFINNNSELNTKLVYGSRCAGNYCLKVQLIILLIIHINLKGLNQFQLQNLSAILDSPPPPLKLIGIERKILPSVFAVAEESMIKRCDELMRITNSKEVLVAVDGCYQKQRGFNSKNGVAVVASPQTSKIIDVSVRTKYCGICHGNNKVLGINNFVFFLIFVLIF